MVFAIGACGGEKTVTIGKQVWMAKNLNDASKGGKCYENKPKNCEKYGRLYNWEEATKACPKGWHLPSDEEWRALVHFVGGYDDVAGNKLKAKSGWESDGGGSDEYGFSALPSGYADSDGSFGYVGDFGGWWSATEIDTGYAFNWIMQYYKSIVYKGSGNKSVLLSVRCVKDRKRHPVPLGNASPTPR